MKTLFIDIDGTVLKHQGSFSDISMKEATLLPAARERMNEWCSKENNFNNRSPREHEKDN